MDELFTKMSLTNASSETDELEKLIKDIDIVDPEEEYDLLERSAKIKKEDNDMMWILKVAEDRYRRYKKKIDLSKYKEILGKINEFLRVDWRKNTDKAWKLMKEIDNALLGELNKAM